MSRMFEALQRSESERFGIDFQQPSSMATELLQEAENDLCDFGQFQSLPITLSGDSRLVSLLSKESLAAENFRFLGVRLKQLQQKQQNGELKKLLVTSTSTEEGKSFVSANLATTLARRQQQKILLLEGDLRRPVLAQSFGLQRLPGLSEWMLGDGCRIKNIYRLDGPALWFLPAGKPPENPLELMQSGKLAQLLDQLTNWFDWIVIDSPPVLPLADASVWARLADGVLLVVREAKTKKRLLRRGVQALEQANLLGLVLNSCADADHSYYQRSAPMTGAAKVSVK
jgi:capsular exopolysaccharide synthesis family protein